MNGKNYDAEKERKGKSRAYDEEVRVCFKTEDENEDPEDVFINMCEDSMKAVIDSGATKSYS